MSILIKGMEMPKNCCECILTEWNNRDDVCRFSGISALNIGRQADCPLIEVEEAPGGFDMPSEERDKYTSLFYAVKKKEQDRCSEAEREYQEKLNQLIKNVIENLDDMWAKGLTPEEYFASFPIGVFSAEPERMVKHERSV